MNLIVAAAALVIATKALDCWTTLRAVGPRGSAETNPVGRWLMRQLGVARAVAVVFVLSAASTIALAAIVQSAQGTTLQWVYVSVACAVACVQGAVAHTNWSGRWNVVTVRVLQWHRAMHALASRLRHARASINGGNGAT